ncbi:hypothetical protein CR970_02720 [Candidatus Saccharibacteria bacterium]|nr:MAG: hypothetical protein CR970_02720 [Candidatus Saccharibacteria bacterium]
MNQGYEALRTGGERGAETVAYNRLQEVRWAVDRLVQHMPEQYLPAYEAVTQPQPTVTDLHRTEVNELQAMRARAAESRASEAAAVYATPASAMQNQILDSYDADPNGYGLAA